MPIRVYRKLIVFLLLFLCLLVSVWFGVRINGLYQAEQESHRAYECYQHLQSLGLAFQEYVQDHDGKLPKAQGWTEALLPYVKDESVFHCPSDPSSARSSYSMNQRVSGLPVAEVSRSGSRTVLLFETAQSGRNPFGGKADVVTPGRHYRFTNPNPGIRFNTLLDLDQGAYYLFVGELQPTYVLQAPTKDAYLDKGILAGKEASHFRW